MRQRREREAEVLNILLQPLIFVEPHLLLNLEVSLLTKCELLRFAHQRKLALASHRVGGARTCENRQGQRHRRD